MKHDPFSRPRLIALALALAACGAADSAPDETVARESSTLTAGKSATMFGNVAGNPVLVQTHNGGLGDLAPNAARVGDFQVVVPSSAAGLVSMTRVNDDPELPWIGPFAIRGPGTTSIGHVDALSFVESVFTTTIGQRTSHNSEVAVRKGNGLYYMWRVMGDDNAGWSDAVLLESGVRGTPSLTQRSRVSWGSLEIVYPDAAGGLKHVSRPSIPSPWSAPVAFATGGGLYDDVTMIESSYRNLELIARSGERLDFVYRDDATHEWSVNYPLATRAAGTPALIQSRYGNTGNFELLVPSLDGGLDYYSRNNDTASMTWSDRQRVYPAFGRIDAVTVIESSYGSPGNFEVVFSAGGSLYAGFRDAQGWEGPWMLTEPLNFARLEASDPPAAFSKVRTKRLGQLTDTNLSHVGGMLGTDLGAAFSSNGKIVFLFGDTQTPDGNSFNDFNLDSMATTSATSVSRTSMPQLTWPTRANGRWDVLGVAGHTELAMEVPTGGISTSQGSFVFFTDGWAEAWPMGPGSWGRSVIGQLSNLSPAMSEVNQAKTKRFFNVAPEHGGDGYVYLFGSGAYHEGPVFLARVPEGHLGDPDRSMWTYYAGTLASNNPIFVGNEDSAVALFEAYGVAELSVRKHPTLGVYMMTYGCGAGQCGPSSTRGIHLRTSNAPWGPWAAPLPIFTVRPIPGQYDDSGYGRVMHDVAAAADDGLSDQYQNRVFGGEYGGYLIPEWFTDDGDSHDIVWVLSTWNPYQAHLMQTTITTGAVPPPLPPIGQTVVLANPTFKPGLFGYPGWTSSGDRFWTYTDQSTGRTYLNTWNGGPNGNGGTASKGSLSQCFNVTAGPHNVHFFVHGGDASVKLRDQHGNVVRQSFGRWSTAPADSQNQDHEVLWNLDEYVGENVCLSIEDELTGDYGYVTVSTFDVR